MSTVRLGCGAARPPPLTPSPFVYDQALCTCCGPRRSGDRGGHGAVVGPTPVCAMQDAWPCVRV